MKGHIGVVSAVAGLAFSCFAESYVSLWTTMNADSEIIEVSADEVLIVNSRFGDLGYDLEFWVVYPGKDPMMADVNISNSDINHVYVGPFSAFLRLPDQTVYSFSLEFSGITFKIESNQSKGIPRITSDAVVIPADASGEFIIKLESSVDLITWNQAIPGDYSGSTEQRFFRVRAERK